MLKFILSGLYGLKFRNPLFVQFFQLNIIIKSTDTLRDYQLSKSTKILHISNGYLKSTSSTPGLSNNPKLRFKSNITGIFVTDIYRIVGDITGFNADRKPVVHSRYMKSGLSA